jgi:hypothetical protein
MTKPVAPAATIASDGQRDHLDPGAAALLGRSRGVVLHLGRLIVDHLLTST